MKMNLLMEFLQAKNKQIKKKFKKIPGYKIYNNDFYTLGISNNPKTNTLLTAHYDLANTEKFYCCEDKEKKALFGKINGDDRAGIYAVWELINCGLNPHFVIFNYEETGGGGSSKFCENVLASKELTGFMETVNFVLALDRQGDNDFVCYENDSKPFRKFLTSFGFKEATGSFSDVANIEDSLNVCGVNLSVGYYNNHTSFELLDLNALKNTIDRAFEMLKANPKRFAYEVQHYSKVVDFYGGNWGSGSGEFWNSRTMRWENVGNEEIEDTETDELDNYCEQCGENAGIRELKQNESFYGSRICNKCVAGYFHSYGGKH